MSKNEDLIPPEFQTEEPTEEELEELVNPPGETAEVDSPTADEMVAGALAELAEQQGLDPLAPPKSLPPGKPSRKLAIPPWFLKVFGNI